MRMIQITPAAVLVYKFIEKKLCLNFEFDYSDGCVSAAACQHEVLRVGPELEAGHGGVVTLGALVDDHEGAPGALQGPSHHVDGAILQPSRHQVAAAGQRPGG